PIEDNPTHCLSILLSHAEHKITSLLKLLRVESVVVSASEDTQTISVT
ncbi:unnamed protein product, partial [Brassica oleracea var. botrytis]